MQGSSDRTPCIIRSKHELATGAPVEVDEQLSTVQYISPHVRYMYQTPVHHNTLHVREHHRHLQQEECLLRDLHHRLVSLIDQIDSRNPSPIRRIETGNPLCSPKQFAQTQTLSS